MTIQGTVTHILPVQSGASKNGGEWHKYGFVLQTDGQYPKSVAIEVWKDDPQLSVRDIVTAHIDIESREHNGRWFTAIKAYKIEHIGSVGNARPAPSQAPKNARPSMEDADDIQLPF